MKLIKNPYTDIITKFVPIAGRTSIPSELRYGQSMAETGRTSMPSELKHRQSGEGGITGRTPMRNFSSHRQSGELVVHSCVLWHTSRAIWDYMHVSKSIILNI